MNALAKEVIPFARIVCDDKKRCGEWGRARLDIDTWGDQYEAIGLERDGELVAAVIYNHFTGWDVMGSIAAIPGRRWLTRDFLRAMFRYPFVQLGVHRFTVHVPEKNIDSIRFQEHVGFVREGLVREGIEGDNCIAYGMLKSECRWL